MIFVDNEKQYDPCINLAIEEHLVRNLNLEGDVLLFYINEPSIIIGRNQNTLEEINYPYVEENQIIVVRRLSGGGAVYHDHGNLNFSFINANGREFLHNFKKFTQPVVNVLNSMGVPAEMNGRNDIVVEERKISGNAQYAIGSKLVSHGTLLYNSDLSKVSEALNVKVEKIESKGIKSVRSRVANISEYMSEPMDVLEFRERVKYGILAEANNDEYKLTRQDWEEINKISKDRYQQWEWNFGRSPKFNIQKTHRFPFGQIDARIEVQNGEIQQLKLFGDFLGLRDVSDVESRLIGVRYDKPHLQEALENIELIDYLGGLTAQELTEFLFA
ncbi:MAG: lipoate--protein ligase [Chloroflexi bacterium HGW-Chloroflexi-3]|nr:MAG: lipoate--protein ligase [Chloroflexi bacterium HGW-Chloroflexi-3]